MITPGKQRDIQATQQHYQQQILDQDQFSESFSKDNDTYPTTNQKHKGRGGGRGGHLVVDQGANKRPPHLHTQSSDPDYDNKNKMNSQ